MNRVKTYDGVGAQGLPSSTQTPVGWLRKVDHNRVMYISPSGSVLTCLEQVKSYLLKNGTCKCGLECPLILSKVFNFDPGAAVRQRTADDVKADEDVTKLCIHKRKIIAVASLHRSMESPHPRLILTSSSGRTGLSQVGSPPYLTLQATRTSVKVPDERNYHQDLGSSPQQDLCSSYSKIRVGTTDLAGQRSPRNHNGILLSPTTAGRSQYFPDGTPSPRRDAHGSLGTSTICSCGTCKPGSNHRNVKHRILLSPVSTLPHGSPAKASCALASHAHFNPSPTLSAKSPIMRNSCSYTVEVFHPKPQQGPLIQPTLSHPQLPPCTLQNIIQLSSEKDPLGILDPIPGPAMREFSLVGTTPGLQANGDPQAPQVNVNMPLTIVPLPDNLPKPNGKSGSYGPSSRIQHTAPSSISPMLLTSPVPKTEHSHSIPSNHSNLIVSTRPHISYGAVKMTFTSPMTSMVSHHPVTQLSSAFGMAQHRKGRPSQQFGMLDSFVGKHVNAKYSSGIGSGNGPKKKQLPGMTLNSDLQQHCPTFPASNLLSAAAKAQLASQKKLTYDEQGSRASVYNAEHGSKGGKRKSSGSVNTMFSFNPCPAISEGQSGRAALRDKLMAQQREALSKSKLLNCRNPMAVNALKAHISDKRSPDTVELMRTVQQQSDIPPNTSMAQLLLSVNSQDASNGQGHKDQNLASASEEESLKERWIPLETTFSGQRSTIYCQSQIGFYQKRSLDGQIVSQNLHRRTAKRFSASSSAKDFWMENCTEPAASESVDGHNLYLQQLNHHYNQDTTPIQGRAEMLSMPNGYIPGLSVRRN